MLSALVTSAFVAHPSNARTLAASAGRLRGNRKTNTKINGSVQYEANERGNQHWHASVGQPKVRARREKNARFQIGLLSGMGLVGQVRGRRAITGACSGAERDAKRKLISIKNMRRNTLQAWALRT